ncbi:NifU family protein [Lachnospiraceae bacterium 62-35]
MKDIYEFRKDMEKGEMLGENWKGGDGKFETLEEGGKVEEIEKILEEEIRPALMEHEGDAAVVSYENYILRIRLLGRCSGCPSARITTEEMIAGKIKQKLPEVKDVILVHEVNKELLDFARQILNHERIEGESEAGKK